MSRRLHYGWTFAALYFAICTVGSVGRQFYGMMATTLISLAWALLLGSQRRSPHD